MPQPTQSQVHVDSLLTDLSLAYMQRQDQFIASRVFPVVPVDKQSDLYFIYTKNDWFRDEAQRRADATESAGSGYGLTTARYAAEVWALHKDIGDQTRRNSDSPLNPDRDATNFVTSRLLLRQEIQWTADYLKTGVWGTDIIGVANGGADATHAVFWDDQVNSDPINDIEAGKAVILGQTGFLPNKLVLGYSVFRYLKTHPDVKDMYKYTSSATVTPQMLAPLFGVDEVVVSQGVKATNQEGAAGVYAPIVGKNALLCFTQSSPSLMAPSAGYIFAWREVSGGLGQTVGISRFRMPQLKADRVEGEIAFSDQIVGADLGYYFSAIVS